jgi:hypothetical protein
VSTAYGDQLKEIMQVRYGDNSAQSYSDWMIANTRLKGRRFGFAKHEYQIAPVDDPARILVMEKCAQFGFTECFFRWIIGFLVKHQGSQGIFTQPTDRDMSTFAKSRADVIFEECPVVNKLGTSGVDSVSLKRIGTSFLNLRGTFGSRAAISVPSDVNNYDEVNFSNPRVLNQYKSRLQHSNFKLERYISTPTIPNYGVSELYNRSDKKRLFLKCHRCNRWQQLDWPTNMFYRRLKDSVILPHDDETFELYVTEEYEYAPLIGCSNPSCQREVSRAWPGREWVAEFPARNRDSDSGISGYHINQLDGEYVSALEIVRASDRRLDGYKRIEDFHNFCLAQPYEGGDSVRITDHCKELATVRMAMPNEACGTFIGVDLGTYCHLIVLMDMWFPNRDTAVSVAIASYRIHRSVLEQRLPELMKRYGALFTVADAQPYTTTVEKIAKAHPKRMSICFYGGKKSYTCADEFVMVTANRTNALDAVTDLIPKGDLLIADGMLDYELVWAHLKHLAKVKAEDDDGEEYYDYVKIGDDHYGHAIGYALLAKKIFEEQKPQGNESCAPVEVVGMETNL